MEAQLRQEARYARSLIEASLDPMFTINPEGKITDINNASLNITDVARENIIGTNFFEYFTEPDKAREIYKQVFSEGFVADFPLTIQDGKLTDVLFNGSVYKDEYGKVLGVVVVARDVTDHKRIEYELIEAKINAEKASEIAEKAKEKAEMAARVAEEAVKSKQQFLSNMSHEIRTPMNVIIGFTKILLKSNLSAKQKEYLSAIQMSEDTLTVLINDILDLAKVDSGKMKFEHIPFNLIYSISTMVNVLDTKIQEKNLLLIKNYDSKIPEVMVGDPVRLHQIILNLISNAVKFTAEGNISIDVQLIKEDETTVTVEFSVTDTGIGIEKDKIENIFENFQQATTETSRLYGGTGLGLAIVKQLVESQGGKIKVDSTIGKGSSFSFILSFGKTDEKVALHDENIIPNTKIIDINVLVVEDMALNQLLIKTLLEDFGFSYDLAENGKIAIDKLKLKQYDIILLDLQMPVMNGFETAKYIRNIMHSDIPIIALTADVTTTDFASCNAAGMNDYVSKPVDEKKLYNKILKLLIAPDSTNKLNNLSEQFNEHSTKLKCIDLTYLIKHTKANPGLMMEMIRLYLAQTMPLVNTMKQSLKNKNWETLHSAAHKMIPSFVIMGINKEFEDVARKIQEYARTQLHLEDIENLITQLEEVCSQACDELDYEYELINKNNS
jgi:PAS domain S-box-containing protein